MLDTSFYLWWTILVVGAVVHGFILVPYQRSATIGTTGDKPHLVPDKETGLFIHSCDLGYDFTAFFHVNPVADVQIKCKNGIFVVQGSPFYGCSRKQNRFKVGYGCYCTGASHLVSNGLQTGKGLLGIEFVSNGPPGELGG